VLPAPDDRGHPLTALLGAGHERIDLAIGAGADAREGAPHLCWIAPDATTDGADLPGQRDPRGVRAQHAHARVHQRRRRQQHAEETRHSDVYITG
jgi:thiamine biosynthesis protein ThiC